MDSSKVLRHPYWANLPRAATTYQEKAVRAVVLLLKKLSVPHEELLCKLDEPPTCWLELLIHEKLHCIEFLPDAVQMTANDGKELFEIYLSDEFGSDDTEISAFVCRLESYFRTGDWLKPGEEESAISPVAWLKGLFTRLKVPR